MSVIDGETGHQDGLLIGHIIAVGVFQIQSLGSVLHHGPTTVDHDGSWNRQAFGENSELVGDVVAVGVFANADAIAVFADFVGVVQRFANPQPTAFVPRHGDRFGDKVIFVGVQFDR